MILASCSYKEYLGYVGKCLITSDEKEEVRLNIVTSGPKEVLMTNLNAMCVTVQGCDDFIIPSGTSVDFFRELSLDSYLEGGFAKTPGVTCLVRLPDDYSDMRTLYDISLKDDSVRFIGGNLLEIPGIKIGRYSTGKEKLSSVFNGVYDYFRECPLDEISVIVGSPSKKKSSEKKGVKKNIFVNMLSSSEEDEF